MSEFQNLSVTPGLRPNTVQCGGRVLTVPDHWELLPPGDPALTRRLKLAGPHWVVQEKKGRRTFSRGIYGPAAEIARIRAELTAERADPAYGKRREADARRRAVKQEVYEQDFHQTVVAYLNFAPIYQALAERLAQVVTEHATPVGSGTVARTERIPVEKRAAAAVIAWLRHQTTDYDRRVIARVRGRRREVRRELAQKSVQLLTRYRRGETIDTATCPLWKALH